MISFTGPRVCPACGKRGKLLPTGRKATQPFYRKYQCQSCHWTGYMFRFIKQHTQAEFYLLHVPLFALLLTIGFAIYKILMLLPEQ